MFGNFTGQHRKSRNINLGGRNSNATNSRESVLRRAQLEREKRERNRVEESAALKIQSFFRGRSQVALARQYIEANWDWRDNLQSIAAKGTPIDQDLHQCLRQFCFFFAQRYNGSELNIKELDQLLDIIKSFDLSAVGHVQLESLLSTSLVVFQNSFSSNASPACQQKVLELILTIPDHISSDLASVLSSYVTKLFSLSLSPSQDTLSMLCQVIQVLSVKFPLDYFQAFLSTPNLNLLSNQLLILPPSTIDLLINEINLAPLSPGQNQVWQLANFITLISEYRLTFDVLHAINKIISSLTVSVDAAAASADDDDNDEDYISKRSRRQEETQNKTKLFKTKDSYLLSAIWKLYSQSFITSVMDLLLPVIDNSSDLLASLFVSLTRLCPGKKQDLTLYISLVPTSKIPGNITISLLLWRSFKKSSLYEDVCSLPPNQVSFTDAHDSLTQLVAILELFSYWLIITDDAEFHGNMSQGGPSLEEIKKLSIFLKNLAYLLIFEGQNILKLDTFSGSFLTVEKIKSISVLVLRQIYIRDSRRQFLENGFWLMTRHFNMESFINEVVEEEEYRRALEMKKMADQDSDSEEPVKLATPWLLELEMLRQVPFFMPFEIRLRIFQAFISLDRRSHSESVSFGNLTNMFGQLSRHKADIRRDHLLEDAYKGFNRLGKDFKSSIGVTFYNEYGPEVGIDGGGITKEFLTSVCREAFQPSNDDEYDSDGSKRGLFSVNKDQLLYPNPIFGLPLKFSELDPEKRREGLRYINFLGKIIGKCLYEEILVDVEFTLFFLQKWTGMIRNSFDDMYSLDPEVYNNLVKVLNYPGNVEDLSLDFTVTQSVGSSGTPATIPLCENGASRSVTNSNRLEYVHAVANYKLNTSLQVQTSAFLHGMSELISLNWLSMFNGPELQMLISGGSATINLQDLRENSVLFEFSETDDTIIDFWQVLEEFSEEDKKRFIKFVTSVAKAPLLGFSVLRPKFAIRNAGNDPNRLPTSSTCVNMIKLPNYQNRRVLQEKLLASIRADAGFDLS